jgi:type IV pilus assembly protein PilM
MLGFVKSFLGAKSSPIGVDFGTDSLKLAQVASDGAEWKLIAAASADVPSEVRNDPGGRLNFFVRAMKDLMARGGFVGRSAVIALPASSVYIQHMRVPKMDEEAIKKALPWEARGKIPIDPAYAVLRHSIAGEVYQDQEPKYEVIVMAASRDLVNQFINMAAKSKLDLVGMNVEPKATVDCFSRIYKRKNDAEATNFFVDVGYSGSRAFIARGSRIMFARSIPIGGEHLTRAVTQALGITFDEAKLLRLNVCNALAQPLKAAAAEAAQPAYGAAPGDRRSLNPIMEPAEADTEAQTRAREVEQACREPLGRLVSELELCRRYYEATFPSHPVDRLVFLGGEAKHRNLCQFIAQEMGLAAQVGDPIVKLSKNSVIPPDSGIDRGQPQPNWAVAIGLSMGAAAGADKSVEAA